MLQFHKVHNPLKKVPPKLLVGRVSYAIGMAIVASIWALYLKSFGLSDTLVGVYAALPLFVTFIFSFFVYEFISGRDEFKLFKINTFLMALIYFLIFIFNNLYVFLILGSIGAALKLLNIVLFNILLKDNSTKKSYPKYLGFVFIFLDIGWLIGPLMIGYFSENFGLQYLYLVSSVGLFLSSLYYYLIHPTLKKKETKKVEFKPLTFGKDFLKSRELVISYIASTGVNFWYSFVNIFMPLYILQSELPVAWVGYYLASINLPLMIILLFMGKISHLFSARSVFFYSFIISGLLAFAAFFISNIYMVLLITIIASIFIGILEAYRIAYFFSLVKPKEEEEYYPLYITVIDVGSIIGRLVFAFFLIFLPISSILLIIAFAMFIYALFSIKIENKVI